MWVRNPPARYHVGSDPDFEYERYVHPSDVQRAEEEIAERAVQFDTVPVSAEAHHRPYMVRHQLLYRQ